MCFSPVASFVASGGLAVIGTATLKKAESRKEVPLASIPLLFGAQQFIEGLLWLSFDSAFWLPVLTNAYAVFANLLWPFYIPLAAYLVEPDKYRRKMIFGLFVVGAILSFGILIFMIKHPINASITSHSIDYEYSGSYPAATLGIYIMVVSVAPLFSSFRMLKVLGVGAILSAFVAWKAYETTFFSVWCFFAAILSIIVYMHFKYAKMSRVAAVLAPFKKAVKKQVKKVKRKL